MKILTTILSLILFFIALGVLVSIHEAGHLIAAKSFGVYCPEYSIGFGPKIFKKKRKGGETTFSIGLLPLGGYVSMYGEGVELPEGVTISRSRSLEGVKRYKRIIIMAAGVFMNFVLAYLIFLISASCFPNVIGNTYVNVGNIKNETTFKESFKDEDNNELSDELMTYLDGNSSLEIARLGFNVNVLNLNTNEYNATEINNLNYYFVLTNNIEYEESSNYALAFSPSINVNKLDFTNSFILLEGEPYVVGETDSATINDVYKITTDKDGNTIKEALPEGTTLNLPIFNDQGQLKAATLKSNTTLKTTLAFDDINSKEDEKITKKFNVTISLDENCGFKKIGYGTKVEYGYLGWSSFKKAGENWVDSTSLIAQAIGNLFTNKNNAWGNVGGPIAIFTQTTTILTSQPFYTYLNTWGVISVNLALFNLLPFPGLDGWQILVELVEGVVNIFYKPINKSRKNKNKEKVNDIKETNKVIDDKSSIDKDTTLVVGNNVPRDDIKYDYEWHIPQKVKNIVSYIGLILLLILMFAIIIKDIVGLI